MKTSTKWAIGIGAGVVAIGGGLAWALSGGELQDVLGGMGEEGHDGYPSGTWEGAGGGFAGGGAGGSLGGKDVSSAVIERGKLPPGSILISGPNLPGRALAAGWLLNRGADFGFIDRETLDKKVPEEGIEGDIESAQFTLVAVSPQGDEAKWFVMPPRTDRQMGEALEEVLAFSGQTTANA